MENTVTVKSFPEIRWHGHWIWIPEEEIVPAGMFTGNMDSQDESHGLFGKSFELDQVPETVPTRLIADSRYVLYANGQEVYRGPIRSQPRRLHYDYFDLAPYLQPGKNVVAVYVKYLGRAGSYWMLAAANSTLGSTGVLVFEADLDEQWLVSDDSWSARQGEAWLADADDADANHIAGGVPSESFDARKKVAGWRLSDFDDGDWGKAQVIMPMHIGGRGRSQPPTDPYGPLLPRPIAKLGGDQAGVATISVESIAEPPDLSANNPAERTVTSALTHASVSRPAGDLPASVAVPEGGYGRLVLDMGRIVGGLATFSINAPAGTIFDFGYFEEPVVERSMFGAHGGNRYIACGADDTHTVFDPKGFRYVIVLIHGVSGKVTLNDFHVQEYHYPRQPGASFECSDADLNDIYQASIRTVALNSWDAFMDCPTREQRAWVGDAVVRQMVHLATNTDWRLAWHYLELSNSPRSDGILPMSVAGDVEERGGVTIPD